jgi:hypothetical protein
LMLVVPAGLISLLDSRGPGESEFVFLHVDTRSSKSHTFKLQQRALTQAGLTRQEDPPAVTEHSLPGHRRGLCVAQRPGDLPGCSRVAGCTGHRPVGRDSPPRDQPHEFLNVVKIAQGFHSRGCPRACTCRLSENAPSGAVRPAMRSVCLLHRSAMIGRRYGWG